MKMVQGALLLVLFFPFISRGDCQTAVDETQRICNIQNAHAHYESITSLNLSAQETLEKINAARLFAHARSGACEAHAFATCNEVCDIQENPEVASLCNEEIRSLVEANIKTAEQWDTLHSQFEQIARQITVVENRFRPSETIQTFGDDDPENFHVEGSRQGCHVGSLSVSPPASAFQRQMGDHSTVTLGSAYQNGKPAGIGACIYIPLGK